MSRVKSAYWVVILAGVVIFSSCSSMQEDNKKEDLEGWKKLNQPAFSILFPDSFELVHDGRYGTEFILFAPIQDSTDKFGENVSLIIQNLKGRDLDLKKYTTLSEGQVRSQIKNGKVISSETLKGADGEFQKIIYTGQQGDFNLYTEQYYFIRNEKAYVVTFTAALPEANKYKAVAEKVLASFKVK